MLASSPSSASPPRLTPQCPSSSTPSPEPIIPSSDALDPLREALATSTTRVRRARGAWLLGLALVLGVCAALLAQLLLALIGLITHLSFEGRIGWSLISPASNRLGPWVVAVPVAGALVIGLMARYGSPAIRGHGIPEAMEQVLTRRSRIAPRVLLLKPLSAAISIGTGGPFGAEGPIIATGGALGSVLGQAIRFTPDERKVLLAAGAAAGMTAVFGTPLAALLLAIELLLFEFSPGALLPVLAACLAAEVVRIASVGSAPFFAMPALSWPQVPALLACAPLGAVIGVAAVGMTRAVYAVEDAFERLPVHWMWWPAIGAVGVGLIGWWQPRTLGVGYANITDALSGGLIGSALWVLAGAKLVSWTLALGSGTSGGTPAPMMTVGACLGAGLGHLAAVRWPQLGLNPDLAALVGMAAAFAGASRALLMSVVFALETTWQMAGLLPLLIGCGAAYGVSRLLMAQTIMTEKISRRGVRVPHAYHADPLAQARVRDYASPKPVCLRTTQPLETVLAWLDSGAQGSQYQGYVVLDEADHVAGVLTRKDLHRARGQGPCALHSLLRQPAVTVRADATLAEAVHLLTAHDIGRLPVLAADDSGQLVGMITRSDVLAVWRDRLLDQHARGR